MTNKKSQKKSQKKEVKKKRRKYCETESDGEPCFEWPWYWEVDSFYLFSLCLFFLLTPFILFCFFFCFVFDFLAGKGRKEEGVGIRALEQRKGKKRREEEKKEKRR